MVSFRMSKTTLQGRIEGKRNRERPREKIGARQGKESEKNEPGLIVNCSAGG